MPSPSADVAGFVDVETDMFLPINPDSLYSPCPPRTTWTEVELACRPPKSNDVQRHQAVETSHARRYGSYMVYPTFNCFPTGPGERYFHRAFYVLALMYCELF